MPEPYQYGVIIKGDISRKATKREAVEEARAWVTSPLRTGYRVASVMRRRGWAGTWKVIDTWSQGFGQQEES